MTDAGVAVWQMAPTIGDVPGNLARLADAAQRARERGATILVTPELALTGYDIGSIDDSLADPGITARVATVAAAQGIAVVAGVALRDDRGTWNASLLIDSGGEIRATYRKAHLFGRIDRSRFTPGPASTEVADLDGVRVGSVVCYDIEFPEPARTAALAGAQVLAVPTANMEPWTFINEHIIPVRAFENGLYVAYANHIGRERRTTYLGRSVIAAPDGRCVRAGADDEEILVMPLDLEAQAAQRAAAPYLTDRRPELYGALTREAR